MEHEIFQWFIVKLPGRNKYIFRCKEKVIDSDPFENRSDGLDILLGLEDAEMIDSPCFILLIDNLFRIPIPNLPVIPRSESPIDDEYVFLETITSTKESLEYQIKIDALEEVPCFVPARGQSPRFGTFYFYRDDDEDPDLMCEYIAYSKEEARRWLSTNFNNGIISAFDVNRISKEIEKSKIPEYPRVRLLKMKTVIKNSNFGEIEN